MELQRDITLSIKHQKTLQVFPYFFIPALNNFYFLKTDLGFLKPKLGTWKNEGYVNFPSKDMEVVIEYDSPNWFGVCFKKPKNSGKIYLDDILKKLNIPFNEGSLKLPKNEDSRTHKKQINLGIQHAGKILKDHWETISDHIINNS